VEYAPRVVERLDEERLETLRAWGTGLSTSARDELRAAGKAILMLVDEIDRLEADLWNARADAKQSAAAAAAATAAAVPDEPPPAREQAGDRPTPAAKPSQVLAMTLSERIAQGRPTETAT
jgi:hypothetical protein